MLLWGKLLWGKDRWSFLTNRAAADCVSGGGCRATVCDSGYRSANKSNLAIDSNE